ncbi:S24 family peptidase [Yersinia enterocolitica]|uniref:S24 family peptidase n=1 Tax=Yersinia enterocolitica TaxID=630 RepID=UPI003D7AB52B
MNIKDIRRRRLKQWFDGKTLPEREKSYLSQLMTGKSTSFGEKAARRLELTYGMPGGYLDVDTPTSIGEDQEIEYVGKVRDGFIPVVGEAILGVDGSMDMVEFKTGWLRIYSDDKEAYGLKVKGDSMHPRIQSGEYVVIEPNTHIHSGDEVFVRTLDGHNMIKVMTKTRDGSYQFSSINNEHKPITLEPNEVEKMHFVSAIVKATRYVDIDEIQVNALNGFDSLN